jgi:hypothetical protein
MAVVREHIVQQKDRYSTHSARALTWPFLATGKRKTPTFLSFMQIFLKGD